MVGINIVTINAAPETDLPVSTFISPVASDSTAVYYSGHPLLIGNDGTAATGGFRVWNLAGGSSASEIARRLNGRSKVVATVYDIDGKDLIITIDQPDSIIRVFNVDKA